MGLFMGLFFLLQALDAMAAIAVPELDAFGWQMFDHFETRNLNQWDRQIQEGHVGIVTISYPNTSYSNSFVNASTSSSSDCYDILTPQLDDPVYGIRADITLSFSEYLHANSFCMAALGVRICPDLNYYFGFFYTGGKVKGTIAVEYNDQLSIYAKAFDVSVNAYYDLAIAFDKTNRMFWLYKNKECLGYTVIDVAGASFEPFVELRSAYANSGMKFDNVKVATVPEPTILALLGLGGWLIRKRLCPNYHEEE